MKRNNLQLLFKSFDSELSDLETLLFHKDIHLSLANEKILHYINNGLD